MHGRSLMTIDPRILTMPGRNTSGFYQPGRHCLHQARSAVACLVSRMKGELTPTKTRLRGGLGGVSVIPWTSSASINQDHQPQATLLKRCPEPKAGSFSCGSGTNSRSTSRAGIAVASAEVEVTLVVDRAGADVAVDPYERAVDLTVGEEAPRLVNIVVPTLRRVRPG